MVSKNIKLYDSAIGAELVFCEEVIEDPDAGHDAGLSNAGLTVVGFDLSSHHELTWVEFCPSQMRVFCGRPYFNSMTEEVQIGPCQLGMNQGDNAAGTGLYIEVVLKECDDMLPVTTVSRYLVIDGVSYLHQLGVMPLPEDVLAALSEYNS